MKLVLVEETCRRVPSQWDAWTDDDRYVYIRYRWGQLTVDIAPSMEALRTARGFGVDTYRIYDQIIGGEFDGDITLDRVLELTGLELVGASPA